MTSYTIGLRLICQTSQFGSEARVSTPGETGAGLTGPPGATPTGARDTPTTTRVTRIVCTCRQEEVTGMMASVQKRWASSAVQVQGNDFYYTCIHNVNKQL